jgi:hypothetical protein
MQKYNLNISLNIKSNTGNKKYTINDFDTETIELINNVYAQDFEMFNYKIKDTKNE